MRFSKRVRERLTVEVGRCKSPAAPLRVPASAAATNVRMSFKSCSLRIRSFRSPFCQPRGYSAKSPKDSIRSAQANLPAGNGLLNRPHEPWETLVARVLRERKFVLRSTEDTRKQITAILMSVWVRTWKKLSRRSLDG
jgi:hypothetical protein